MTTSALNPPDSPPAAPVISEGLATKALKIGAAIFFVLGALIYALDLDIDIEAILAAGLAAVSLFIMAAGRYAQAYAIFRDAPKP